jgi:hypothetical protein
VCSDSQGNVYVAGVFEETANFAADWGETLQKTSAGGDDGFAVKIGSDGGFEWAHRLGAENDERVLAACADGSGNLYLATFYMSSTVDFAEDWGGTDPKARGVNTCIAVTKVGSGGNYGWTHSLGSSGTDVQEDMCTDGSGNVYVAGRFDGGGNFAADWGGSDIKGSAGAYDAFVTKINAAGTYGWTHRMGKFSEDIAYAVCADNSGNVYLAGYYSSDNINFAEDWGGSDSKPVSNYGDAFITKMGANGSYCWTRRIPGSTSMSTRIYAADTDSSGNLYVAGYFGVNVDFAADWGGSDMKSCVALSDAFVTKIAANGSYCWTHRLGGFGADEAYDVCTDSSGNVYVTGQFEDTVYFAQDWGGTDPKDSSGQEDIFLTKIGADGSYCWTRKIGSQGDEKASSICIGPGGSLYLTGYFGGTVDFAADFGGTEQKSSISNTDVFVTKILP